MKKLGDFMNSALARKGLKKTTESAYVCFLAEKEERGRYKTVSFSDGVLKVSVTSSSAAQALQMEEEGLIDQINKAAGKAVVKRVKIINTG